MSIDPRHLCGMGFQPMRGSFAARKSFASSLPRHSHGQDAHATTGASSRRDLHARTATGCGSLALAGLLDSPSLATPNSQLATPPFAPRAKRVIFLFLNGGPSHVDTFDPKPALAKYEGTQPTGKLYRQPKGSGFMPSPFKF